MINPQYTEVILLTCQTLFYITIASSILMVLFLLSVIKQCPSHPVSLTQTSGYFASPQFNTGYTYPNQARCVWNISVPSVMVRINVYGIE